MYLQGKPRDHTPSLHEYIVFVPNVGPHHGFLYTIHNIDNNPSRFKISIVVCSLYVPLWFTFGQRIWLPIVINTVRLEMCCSDTESLRLLPFYNVTYADKGMLLSQLFHWIVITAIYNDFEWKASTHYDLTIPYGFFDTRNVHRNIIICIFPTSTHSWVNGWMLINVYRKVQPPTLEKAACGNSPRDKGTDHGSIYVPIYVPFNPSRIFL